VAERRPQQAARARAAVIPFRAGPDWAAIVRLLPSGRSLALGFAIVLGAAGLYTLARVTPMFALSRIEVEGAPPGVAARVRAALQPLDGTSLLALNGVEIERRLSGLTAVASATYDRDFPHTLRVVVRPEHPVAVVRHGADGWIVAASGRVLAATAPRTARALPRVWITSDSPHPGAALTDHFGMRAIRALALARKADLHGRVRAVRAADHELTFLLASGLQVRLGDLRAVRLKLAVASRVLPRLPADGGYAYLDVSVPERPVAGTNPQPEG
jgi:cell division protein FtsQ